jgi:hypothetical protein
MAERHAEWHDRGGPALVYLSSAPHAHSGDCQDDHFTRPSIEYCASLSSITSAKRIEDAGCLARGKLLKSKPEGRLKKLQQIV